MNRKELEKEFTSMLVKTDSALAYVNLCNFYLNRKPSCRMNNDNESELKLNNLRLGSPYEWIYGLFTEGFTMPPSLYKANIHWQKHLEDINWE